MGRIADTKMPSTLTLGESLWVTVSFQDYPSSTHSLKLFLDGTSSQTVDGVANPDGSFTFTVNASTQTTQAWTTGPYAWRMIATRTADSIATLADSGFISLTGVDHDLAYARTIMFAIDALIGGRATKEQSSFSVDGVAISFMPVNQLLDLHHHWQNEVARLERRSMNSLGFGGPIRTISPRFDNSAPGRPLFPRLYP